MYEELKYPKIISDKKGMCGENVEYRVAQGKKVAGTIKTLVRSIAVVLNPWVVTQNHVVKPFE